MILERFYKHFVINFSMLDRETGRKNVKEFDDHEHCILLWRDRLLEEKDNVVMICFHNEQFFGKVFERKADK